MTRTQVAILWVLGALIAAILAALGYIYSLQAQSERPAVPATSAAPAVEPPPTRTSHVYSLPETPYSAQSLYAGALEAARTWQPDATLVSASTSWPFVQVDDFSRPVDWTFQFTSPGTQGIYVVNVSETQVTLIRETLSPYRLPTIPVEQWQLDSNQALNAWLEGGGGDYLRGHPVVDVSARLTQSREGPVVWAIAAADGQSDDVHAVRIDASSGSTLP